MVINDTDGLSYISLFGEIIYCTDFSSCKPALNQAACIWTYFVCYIVAQNGISRRLLNNWQRWILACELDCSRLLALRWGSRAILLSSGQTEVQNLDLRHRGLLSCRPGEKIWLFIWPTVNTKAWLHNLGDKSDSSVGVLTFKSWFVLGELLSGSKGFDLRRRIKLPSGRRTLTFQNTSLTESFETEKIKAVCLLSAWHKPQIDF